MTYNTQNPLFQFHKGTIKTGNRLFRSCVYGHFNSIKVQLKRRSLARPVRASEFQFHKGTIKT